MPDTITIVTNHVPRYIEDDWDQEGEQNDAYVVYKGEKYLLDDFSSVSGMILVGTHEDHPFRGWDGFLNDSFFSGILIKWVPGTDWEQVIMGRFYS